MGAVIRWMRFRHPSKKYIALLAMPVGLCKKTFIRPAFLLNRTLFGTDLTGSRAPDFRPACATGLRGRAGVHAQQLVGRTELENTGQQQYDANPTSDDLGADEY